jgi:hypothetical protein
MVRNHSATASRVVEERLTVEELLAWAVAHDISVVVPRPELSDAAMQCLSQRDQLVLKWISEGRSRQLLSTQMGESPRV